MSYSRTGAIAYSPGRIRVASPTTTMAAWPGRTCSRATRRTSAGVTARMRSG
jgi:hypothetical protein